MNKKTYIIFLIISSLVLVADICFDIFSKDIKKLSFWIFLTLNVFFLLKLKSQKKTS